MPVFTDTVGNVYLNNCIYANHNIQYPTTNYLQAGTLNSLSIDLSTMLATAGLLHRNVLPQTLINNWLTNASPSLRATLFHFGNQGDIDDRFSLAVNIGGNGTASGGPSQMFNANGSTNTTNALDETVNLLMRSSYAPETYSEAGGGVIGPPFSRDSINFAPVQVCGVANNLGVSLYFTQKQYVPSQPQFIGQLSYFVHAGRLANINNTTNRYLALENSSIVLAGGVNSFNAVLLDTEMFNNRIRIAGRHFISGTRRNPLYTGRANYQIVCADGQNPTAVWATDMYVADNASELGFPFIGRVPNLLLAQGDFILNKVVRIEGSVFPDSGSNAWIPVGNYAEKVLLMRCYSSVNI